MCVCLVPASVCICSFLNLCALTLCVHQPLLLSEQLKTVLATALQDPDARGIILRIIDQVQAEVRPDTISRGLEETATTLKTEKETPAAEGETANETAERETALQKTGHESTAQVERGHETTGPEPTSQEAEGKDTSKETVTNESSNIEEGVCGSERAHH